MTPMLYIRERVFQVTTQTEWAESLGVAQSTVSRWESGLSKPESDVLLRLRSLAYQWDIQWNDDWFFAAPSPAAEEAAE